VHPERFTVPLSVRGALADRAVLCPSAVLAILERLLGAAFVMNFFGVTESLPDADDETWQSDALLFPDTPVDRLMPPFAFASPLPLDEITGCTNFR
jgi:hypothetical protein